MNYSWRRPPPVILVLSGALLVVLLAACAPAATNPGSSLPTTATTQPPTATPSATPTPLALTLGCGGGKQDTSFGPGPQERVCANTAPGAALTIKATFCLGSVDQSNALKGTFTADQKGYYEWNWKPVVTCEGNPPGVTGFWHGTAEVTARLDGQSITESSSFLV